MFSKISQDTVLFSKKKIRIQQHLLGFDLEKGCVAQEKDNV